MPVSQKEMVAGKNQFVEKGKIEVTVPTLADCAGFVTNAKQKEGADGTDAEGLPIYETDEANFIQAAIIAAVKVMVRNRVEIVNGEVKLKDGQSIPTNWAELVAESDRTNGEALAILREAKDAFGKWVATLNKSEGATKTLTQLFNVKAARQTQSNDKKAKFGEYVNQFMESLSVESLERFSKVFASIAEDLKTTEEANDF